jgi:hypothetical protein
LLFLGGVALVLLGAGMALDSAIAVMWGIALLGGQFVLSLYTRDAAASLIAAVYGSALLLVSELALWSVELGVRHRGVAMLVRRRASGMGALVAASLVVGLSAAAISQASLPGSIALTAVGIGGVLAGIAIVALLLWERSVDGP